jgi:hypothetical protein
MIPNPVSDSQRFQNFVASEIQQHGPRSWNSLTTAMKREYPAGLPWRMTEGGMRSVLAKSQIITVMRSADDYWSVIYGLTNATYQELSPKEGNY